MDRLGPILFGSLAATALVFLSELVPLDELSLAQQIAVVLLFASVPPLAILAIFFDVLVTDKSLENTFWGRYISVLTIIGPGACLVGIGILAYVTNLWAGVGFVLAALVALVGLVTLPPEAAGVTK